MGRSGSTRAASRRSVRPIGAAFLLFVLFGTFCGCSLRRLAVNAVGDALAAGGSTYAREDDPELAKAAIPFGLKTVEGLLDESPRHTGLLLAAASGFAQYAYAFVHTEADYLRDSDPGAAESLRGRALGLYLRARDYGLRGLQVAHPGFQELLPTQPEQALGALRKEDVPFLYWVSAAWGAAISLAKDDPELTADISLVGRMMERALVLDEGFGAGSIHDFFIAYDGGRPAAAGGSVTRAREHLDAALRLSGRSRAAPFVAFAETVSVGSQNRAEFEGLLREALAVDVQRAADYRLANRLAQRRARWLLGRADQLFIE